MIKLQEAKELRDGKVNKIELLKQTGKPIDFFNNLENLCKGSIEDLTDTDKNYFLKCFGIFHKDDDTFMLRVRIPAGQLTFFQAIEIGKIAIWYGENYIDITTRQQIELRYLKFNDLYEVIKQLQNVGISTFQTGIDNFRNIVTSSFDGLGNQEIIECKPIINSMQEIFLEDEEWIGTLPRKFNTAILGTSVNDCNIYGHDCCFIVAKKDEKIGFNLYLGGKVGVQATNSGIFVEQKDVTSVYKAIINLFKEFGFRDNRNKNRLHFLLEAVGMDEFVKAIKVYSSLEFQEAGEILAKDEFILDSDGILTLNENLIAYNFSIPSGIFTGEAMMEAGTLAELVLGQIRLSVEQSFYIVCKKEHQEALKNSSLSIKYHKYQNIYFRNLIACAGTKTCSFGVIPCKSDAIEMANYLTNEIPFDDGKIRFYWSGCPKGCGIHGVGDIGFEGCKAKDENGNKVDGVHIFIGGKATLEAKEARILYKALPLDVAKEKVKEIVLNYKNNKLAGESFEEFESRVTM
ncbi:MAG: ferredoxin--nitrite reductase [Arcobacteraceae bacterium]|nr:ferredoxin--nitrite reductase [Arcobacteraceae bacterium]